MRTFDTELASIVVVIGRLLVSAWVASGHEVLFKFKRSCATVARAQEEPRLVCLFRKSLNISSRSRAFEATTEYNSLGLLWSATEMKSCVSATPLSFP